MLVPAGLRLVGAYAAASEESPAKLAALARQLGGLLPPHLVSAHRISGSIPSTGQHFAQTLQASDCAAPTTSLHDVPELLSSHALCHIWPQCIHIYIITRILPTTVLSICKEEETVCEAVLGC